MHQHATGDTMPQPPDDRPPDEQPPPATTPEPATDQAEAPAAPADEADAAPASEPPPAPAPAEPDPGPAAEPAPDEPSPEAGDDSPTVERAEVAGPSDAAPPGEDEHTAASPEEPGDDATAALPPWAPSPLRDFETATEQLPVTHEPVDEPVHEPGHGPGELPFLPLSPGIPAGDHEPAAGWPVTSPEKPRRRGARWLAVAAVLAVLLCGGGGVSAFFLLRNAEDTDGAPDPGSAVNRFLTAVYTDQNADQAAELVCRESRDAEKLAAKVAEVRTYATTYTGPTFSWNTPTIADEREERAVVTVKLTMTTTDEKTAEQQLTFTTVRRTGWWVCEVSG